MSCYECVVVIVVGVAFLCCVWMTFESNASMVEAMAFIALHMGAVQESFTSHW